MHLEDLRLAIYDELARTGRLRSVADLARTFAISEPEVHGQLQELATARHIVLDTSGTVVMAHPFATIPLGFAVMGRSTLWWGGCAWDSFAMPAVLPGEPEVLVSTRCPGCRRPLAWVVGRDGPPAGNEVAHFLTPVQQIWDDVVHSCANQRLFCRSGCVDDWLGATGNERGYVMDLPTLWRLARHWYDGRLERDYVRREPVAAAAYFREVGLHGRFWGLDE
jgi:hypothetical protein